MEALLVFSGYPIRAAQVMPNSYNLRLVGHLTGTISNRQSHVRVKRSKRPNRRVSLKAITPLD